MGPMVGMRLGMMVVNVGTRCNWHSQQMMSTPAAECPMDGDGWKWMEMEENAAASSTSINNGVLWFAAVGEARRMNGRDEMTRTRWGNMYWVPVVVVGIVLPFLSSLVTYWVVVLLLAKIYFLVCATIKRMV
jgi:hypothetical protein